MNAAHDEAERRLRELAAEHELARGNLGAAGSDVLRALRELARLEDERERLLDELAAANAATVAPDDEGQTP